MPPAVAGLGLLVAFGRLGLLGHTLSVLGIDLVFTQAAVVIAILFVASPFYIRGAIAAFEAIDPTLLDVAGTLGAGPLRRMLRVAIPLARSGLAAAAALAFARGIGEFGATILFAGSFQGTHADAAARGLLAVRRQPRSGGRDRRAADHRQRCDPAHLEAARRSWTPRDRHHPPPASVRSSRRADARCRDGRAGRPVGRRQDLAAAHGRGARAPAARPDRARRRVVVRHARRTSTSPGATPRRLPARRTTACSRT